MDKKVYNKSPWIAVLLAAPTFVENVHSYKWMPAMSCFLPRAEMFAKTDKLFYDASDQ
jgi:hypothetical protein